MKCCCFDDDKRKDKCRWFGDEKDDKRKDKRCWFDDDKDDKRKDRFCDDFFDGCHDKDFERGKKRKSWPDYDEWSCQDDDDMHDEEDMEEYPE